MEELTANLGMSAPTMKTNFYLKRSDPQATRKQGDPPGPQGRSLSVAIRV